MIIHNENGLLLDSLDDTTGKFFSLEVFVHIYLPQTLTDTNVHSCPITLRSTWDRYMSILGHLPTNRCCGAVPCFCVFQVDNISSDHSILSTLIIVKGGQFKLYWAGVVHLCLCHMTRTVVAFQHTHNEYHHVQQVAFIT